MALTGAAGRIPDAIELLAAERGKRLLITGVHRDTRAREIARLTPLYAKYFRCCIDLGRDALNTFGNALETKRWAVEHNFNSLIVVTSNWHMPRAMAEIRHQLPFATLIAYPVVAETRAEAVALIEAAHADAVAVGRAVIANPDLVERWQGEHPENEPRPHLFYASGAEGYTDYPTLKAG